MVHFDTAHGGVIVGGYPKVLIGEQGEPVLFSRRGVVPPKP